MVRTFQEQRLQRVNITRDISNQRKLQQHLDKINRLEKIIEELLFVLEKYSNLCDNSFCKCWACNTLDKYKGFTNE